MLIELVNQIGRSAGTDADDSEWIVLEQNDWSDLGMHTC